MADYDFSAFDNAVKNKADETSAYDLSAFDKAKDQAEGKSPEMSQLEALARSAAKGASMNFADEIAGAMASPQGALEAASRYVGGSGEPSPQEQAYKQAQQEYSAKEEEAAKQYPKTSLFGELGGGAAGMLAGGVGVKTLGKGIPLLARLAQGAGIGTEAAAAGALAGAGQSEAQGDVGQLAKDVGTSAALSAGLGKAAGALGEKLTPSSLKKEAAKEMVQMTGMTPANRAKLGEKAQQKIGETLLESGVAKPGSTTENVLNAVSKLNDQSGKEIGSLVKSSGNKGIVDPQKIKATIEEQLGPEFNSPLNKDIQGFYNNLKSTLDSLGNKEIPFEQAENLKKLVASRGWVNGKPIETEVGAQARQAWKVISDSNEAALDQYAKSLDNPEMLKAFQEAKDKYFATQKVLNPLEVKSEKEASKSLLSPSNIAAAGAGALAAPHVGVGQILGGAAGYVAKKGLEKYAPALSPTLKYGAAKTMEGAAELPLVGKALTKGIDLTKPVVSPSNIGRVGANHLTRALSGYTPEQLKATSQKLSSSGDPVSQGYSRALDNISEQKDPQMKNAMLFSLEQQDGFRERMKLLDEAEVVDKLDNQSESEMGDTGEQ